MKASHVVLAHDDLIDLLSRVEVVEGVDLSALKFEALESGEEYVFQNCALKDARIKGDGLRGSHWIDCQFENCEFGGVDLREAVFENCQFFDAKTATGALFRFCDMKEARFKSCDLSMSNLTGCTAFEAEFSKCKMPGFTLEKTDFSREFGNLMRNAVCFGHCNMIDANLCEADLSTCVIKHCDLSDADLSFANLRSAEITECNLYAVDFKQSDLSGCDLRGSALDGFVLAAVKDYQGLQISASQQHLLLNSIGIDVSPDDE